LKRFAIKRLLTCTCEARLDWQRVASLVMCRNETGHTEYMHRV